MSQPHELGRYAPLLDALPDPAILLDREGGVLYVNKACEGLLGWDRADLIREGAEALFDGFPLTELLRAPASQLFGSDAARQARDGVAVRKSNGEACSVALRLSPLPEESGAEPMTLLHLHHQLELPARRASFRTLFESADDLVFMKGTDQRYLAINPSMCLLFGREEEDLIGCRSSELFTPAVAERMDATDLRVLAGERVEEVHEFPGEDGTLRIYNVLKSPIHSLRGGITGICGIAREVTETERLQRRVKENEERLRALTDNLPGVVFSHVRDAQGRLQSIYRSAGIVDLVGEENALALEAEAIEYLDLIHPEDRAQFPVQSEGLDLEGRQVNTEYRLQDGKGGYRWVQAIAMGIALEDGGILWHGVVLDAQERKQMERELFELNEMLTEIAAQIPGVVYSYSMLENRYRDILYFSPDLVGLIGSRNAKLLTEDFNRLEELIHPEDLDSWLTRDQILGDGRFYFDLEFRLRHDDGRYRWVHSRANGHRQHDGRVHWNGIMLDIDDSKRIEAELAETSNRLQSLADGMPGAVYTYTSDAEFQEDQLLYVSPGIKALVGADTADRLRKEANLYDKLIHPDDLERCVPRSREAGTERLLFDKEYRLRHDEGDYRWVHDLAYGYSQPDGKLIWHGMLLDIDANKRAEAQLELVSAQLMSISENLPGMVFSYIRHADRTRTQIYLNETHLVELIGPENGARLMDNLDALDDLLHPDDRARIPEPQPSADGSRLLFEMEYRLRKDDGGYRWVHSRSYGFPQEDGSTAWHGFLLDIDDRRRAEDQLRLYSRSLERSLDKLNEAKAQAEQASRAKSQFMANMSHEIRTPLTAVLGFAELLGDRLERPENRESLEMIRTNGRHLLELVNDVLDLTKIESGRFRVESERIDACIELRAAVNMMAPRARDKGLQLELRIDEGLAGEVPADGTRLRQVFLNLIGNALKFTTMGSVTVVASERNGASRQLCVEVIDTGLGLETAAAESLFEAFVQGENVGNSGGTGLGLAISRELVELMGGRIEVESVIGQGSCFRVLLPLATPVEASELEPPQALTPLSDLAARLLVAEDNQTNQQLILAILGKDGCELDLVEDGLEAVERVQAEHDAGRRYDAILMDIQMPILDGLSAARRIRAAGHDMPIIALTAHVLKSDRADSLAAGCSAHCSKPIDRAILTDTLARLIAEHRASGNIPSQGV